MYWAVRKQCHLEYGSYDVVSQDKEYLHLVRGVANQSMCRRLLGSCRSWLSCPLYVFVAVWRANCFKTFTRASICFHTRVEYSYAYEMISYVGKIFIRS